MHEKKNQFHALASRLVKIFCLRLFAFGIMNAKDNIPSYLLHSNKMGNIFCIPIKWELNRNSKRTGLGSSQLTVKVTLLEKIDIKLKLKQSMKLQNQ